MPKTDPFEKYADEYDKWFDDNKIIYESEVKAIKKILPAGNGVEIGLGTGRFAVPLKIKNGIEPSLKMRDIAVKRGINAINGTGENIPFQDGLFDFVLLVTTLCFLDDVDLTLKEIRRILKKRGSVIIGFIDKDSAIGKQYLSIKDNDPFYKEAIFYGAEEISRKLKQNGFDNLKYIQTIFGNIKEIKKIQIPQNGYGKGSFIVIKSDKI